MRMALYKSNTGAYVSGPIDSLFYDLPMAAGNMSYDWVVPNVTVNENE